MALLPTDRMDSLFSPRRVWMDGPIIVGAGPSGLAVAASLREQGVPLVILERADCIASLWQKRTYDRLKLHFPKLHLPKQFCELPRMPFPEHYPEYPTRRQFIDYFDIKLEFNHTVLSASCDETSGLWRVRAAAAGSEMEYIGRWLVLATGENAESVVPDTPGLAGFGGEVTHVSQYKSSKSYRGKFDIKTEFNHAVLSVRFVETSGLWWHPPPRPRPPPSAPRSRTQRRLPPPRVPDAVASPITQPRRRRPSRR